MCCHLLKHLSWFYFLGLSTCLAEPYIGCPYPCPWVLGGHGCDIIGNVISKVTMFKYMGGHGWAYVGTCHAMGGHRLLLMGVAWVWVQIRRKCWSLMPSKGHNVVDHIS